MTADRIRASEVVTPMGDPARALAFAAIQRATALCDDDLRLRRP